MTKTYNNLSIFLIISIIFIFFMGGFLTVRAEENINLGQTEIKIAMRVLAEEADRANHESDIVRYKDAYNLLRRKVTDTQFRSEYDSYFERLTKSTSQSLGGGANIYCSDLFKNPFLAIKAIPGIRHKTIEELFQVLNNKIDSEGFEVNEITNLLTNIKATKLTVQPEQPNTNYFILKKNNYDLLLERRDVLQQLTVPSREN